MLCLLIAPSTNGQTNTLLARASYETSEGIGFMFGHICFSLRTFHSCGFLSVMACTRLGISFFFLGLLKWTPPKSSQYKKWHKTNGVNFRTLLSGARGIGHDVSHLNTGGRCAWELSFPQTLPVAFPLGPAIMSVSPGTKISNLDGICA